jgi:hypothetical protein
MFCYTLKNKNRNMKRHTWLAVPILIVLYCCNAEKRVLNNPQKTQHVVTKWLKDQPFGTDTTIITKPGDTVTQLLIGYDTTIVRDTISHTDTVKVTQRVYKTVTRVDTLVRTIIDNRLLSTCQTNLRSVDDNLKSKINEWEKEKIRAAKWVLMFWALVAFICISTIAYLVVKLKLF